MAAPEPVVVKDRVELQAFARDIAKWRDFLTTLEDLVFVQLPTRQEDAVGAVTGQLLQSPLLDPTTADFLDARAEVANYIAAAAAIEKTTYANLAELVKGLVAVPWEGFALKVATAALLRFPNQTNLFVLTLIETGSLPVDFIYNFAKNRYGVKSATTPFIFAYFLPELAALPKQKFIIQYWRELVTDKSPESPFTLLVPAELKDIKPDGLQAPGVFDAFKALRAAGRNPSELLTAIRTDNLSAFLPFVASNKYDQTIEFSLYEQYFHFDYELEAVAGDQSDRKRKFKKLPNIIDAIALLGAVECFNAVITAASENVSAPLNAAVNSLVAAGSENGFLARAIDAGVNVTADNLVGAVRFHNQNGLIHLLENQTGGKATDEAIGASAQYANFAAFDYFNEHHVCDAFKQEGAPTLLHYIARGNAITAFKLYLSSANTQLYPWKVTKNKRTFLSWAADADGYEVAKFWLETLKIYQGLNQHDEANRFPDVFAGARAPYIRSNTKDDLIADVSPIYALLVRAIDTAATEACDAELAKA